MRKVLGFEYHLIDTCNLNCAGCIHYAPLSDDRRGVHPARMEDELRLLKARTLNGDAVAWLRLMGGEPLLHPEIDSCLSLARALFPASQISVVTNGLKLSTMPRGFFDACRINGITVAITDYGIIDDPREFLRKHGVVGKWFRDGRRWYYQALTLTGRGDDVCFERCQQRIHCMNYRQGKIFLCAQIAYIELFNRFFGRAIELSPLDYIDLRKVATFRDLVKRIAGARPAFCSTYCNNTQNGGIPPLAGPWRRSKRQIEEFCAIHPPQTI